MKPRDLRNIMGYLSGLYPNTDIGEATIGAYGIHLLPLEYDEVMHAARLAAETSKFFPTVAELLENLPSLNQFPSPDEAWSQVLEAADSESTGGMHELVKLVFKRTVGGTWNPDLGPGMRRFFLDSYREARDKARRDERVERGIAGSRVAKTLPASEADLTRSD